MRKLIGLSLLWLLSWNAVAATSAKIDAQLAHHPQWLALLHMRPVWWGRISSQADEPSFFLSGISNDPLAEMEATIAALKQNDASERSMWCVFPARAAWLRRYIDIYPPIGLSCPALDAWRQQFKTDKLVLVFPDMYAQNPASLFGHTFFRFDGKDKTSNPILLSAAMSYYAAVGSSGGTIKYIANGLSGGFDGVFEVKPYFEKIKKYSDNEDRDIYEYELALNSTQIAQLVDHVWEVRGHTFNYFFLDENCSYRLVALLDAVVAPYTMRFQFPLDVMPLDTIKVLDQHGFVRATTFVPSAVKQFRQEYDRLTPEQQSAVLAWKSEKQPVSQLQQHSSVQTVAAHYAGVRLQQGGTSAVRYRKDLKVLWRESIQKASADLPAVPVSARGATKAADPARQSHGTRRAALAWQHTDEGTALRMGVRMAYHDEQDPVLGFSPGVRLEAMDINWQWSGGDGVSLEHITWFAVRSRKPRDAFFQPVSWGAALTRRRELLGDDWSLVHAIDAERGVTYDCAAWLCHAEALASSLWGGKVNRGLALGVGARVGALYQGQYWNIDASIAQLQYLQGESGRVQDYSVAISRQIQRDMSVGVKAARKDNGESVRDEFSVGVRYYF